MFPPYYATRCIFQSLKLMAFQWEWPHLRKKITILLLQMNTTPWWGEEVYGRRMVFNAGSLSYHITWCTRMHEHTQPHQLSRDSFDCVNVGIVQRERQQQGEGWASGEAARRGGVRAAPCVQRLTHFISSLFLSHPPSRFQTCSTCMNG